MYQVFTSRFPGAALFKMANSFRLASACALQVIWVIIVWHLSWHLIRPAVLTCLFSRGPLGPSLSFYHVRVRCLDVVHFNCKGELGATKHGGSALWLCSPCFAQVLINVVRRLQTCGTLCDIVSLGLDSFARLQVGEASRRGTGPIWVSWVDAGVTRLGVDVCPVVDFTAGPTGVTVSV